MKCSTMKIWSEQPYQFYHDNIFRPLSVSLNVLKSADLSYDLNLVIILAGVSAINWFF